MSVAGQSWKLAPPVAPVRSSRASVREGTARWASPALVFIFAAGATFSIVLLRESMPNLPSVSTLLYRASASSDLGLTVDTEGSRLVLRWSRQNPLMLSATGANLLIQDGSQRRTIHLDATQLGNGSVAYKPVSNDVNFRLEVSGPEGLSAASMRVLDGTPATASKPGGPPSSPLPFAAKKPL